MLKSLHHDIYTGAIILIASVLFSLNMSRLPTDARVYPLFVIGLLIFLSILLIIDGIKKTKKENNNEQVNYSNDEEKLKLKTLKMPTIIFASTVLYVILMPIIGFFVSTSFLLIAVMIILKNKNVLSYIGVVLITNIFIYLLFVQMLHVRLPQGILF